MPKQTQSLVTDVPPPAPEVSRDFMAAKLALHTDAWDVAEDLKHGVPSIVVVDARSSAAYAKGHVPGAVSLPHREMCAATTAHFDRGKTYVVYCDGIGCNGSTRGAYKLAALGFQVKEMLGGLDFWIRDGRPIVQGTDAGSMANAPGAVECGCG